MVGTIVHQLTRNLTEEQIKAAGFDSYFVDHTTGVYPTAASGSPWSAATMQVTGDTIADLTEDLAADAAIMYGQHTGRARKSTDRFPGLSLYYTKVARPLSSKKVFALLIASDISFSFTTFVSDLFAV